ncbi:HIT family protein [bacterium]|nr:HIT family protein [bacterium]
MKTDPNCIFCKIVAGELPKFKVYEDENTLSFLTIEPMSKGHTLVIPKEHVPNVFETSPDTWSLAQETVRKVAHAVEKAMQADGVNINMNNREHAGQVVDHFHIHIIPRYKGDDLQHWPTRKIAAGEGDEISTKISSTL